MFVIAAHEIQGALYHEILFAEHPDLLLEDSFFGIIFQGHAKQGIVINDGLSLGYFSNLLIRTAFYKDEGGWYRASVRNILRIDVPFLFRLCRDDKGGFTRSELFSLEEPFDRVEDL